MQESDKTREEKFKALDRMRAAFKDVPDEELEREVTKALAAVRLKNRKRKRPPAAM